MDLFHTTESKTSKFWLQNALQKILELDLFHTTESKPSKYWLQNALIKDTRIGFITHYGV